MDTKIMKVKVTVKQPTVATTFVALFIIYWIVFFGYAFIQTLLLCYNSNFGSIYHILGEERIHTAPTQRLRSKGAATKSYHLAASLANHNTSLPQASSANATAIPLILHRMWRDESIPRQWRNSYEKCKRVYGQKNWTTMLWTDDMIRAFLEQHYKYFLSTYDSYWYDIQRVDAARYFILYHYGGVYLDLDVGCRDKRDITSLVRVMEAMNMGSLFPMTDPIGVSNDVMFASKGNKFFRGLIETLPNKNRWYGLPYITVLYSTGPMFLSLACMHYPKTKEEVLALSQVLYSKTDARYFRHLQGSTWHSSDAYVVKWLARNHLMLLVAFLFAYALIKYYTKTKRFIRSELSIQRVDFKPIRLSL